MEGLNQSWMIVGMTIFQWALAYWVYRDSAIRSVPYRNFWIVVTFLFWPGVIIYLFYRHRTARGMQLTLEQKASLHMQERAETEKKRIAAHRAAIEKMKAEEQTKNKLTEAEMETLREQRKAAKAKRMAELEEERQLQEEHFADTLRVKQENLAHIVSENLKPKQK